MSEQPQEQQAAQVPMPEIRYYEAEGENTHRVSLTCHDCRVTFDFKISKTRTLKVCPCCTKPAEVKEIS